MSILIPVNNLTDTTVFELISEITENIDKHIILDFINLKFARPFPILILANEIAFIKQVYGNTIDFKGENSPNASYLKHMGFFQFARIEETSIVSNGNNRYLPITLIDRQALIQRQMEIEEDTCNSTEIEKVILDQSEKLSILLMPFSQKYNLDIVSYCFTEVIRNVFEHSGADQCSIFGQTYNNFGHSKVDICLVDKGCGILETLKNKYPVNTHIDAIEFALQPGVSSKNTQSVDTPNAGFGLFVISELAKRFGNFMVCSGDSLVKMCKENKQSESIDFKGTALSIRVNIDEEFTSEGVLNEIINDGEMRVITEKHK